MVSSFLLSTALLQPPKISPELEQAYYQPVIQLQQKRPSNRQLSQLLSSSSELDTINARLVRSNLYLFVNGLPEQISVLEQGISPEQLKQIELKQHALTTILKYLPLKGFGIEMKMATDVQSSFFDTLFKVEGTRMIETEDTYGYRLFAKTKAVNLALNKSIQTLKIYHGEDSMKQLLLDLEANGLVTQEQRELITKVLETPHSPKVNTSNK